MAKLHGKYRTLFLSLLFDLAGMSTFLIPGVGEYADIVWAPIAGYLITRMYPGEAGKAGGIIGFLEEIIPGTDWIPTFTLMWIYTYVYQGKKQKGPVVL